MSTAGSAHGRKVISDPVLAELVEELTNRLQADATFDLEAFLLEHSEQADRLRRLLPTLQMLGDLRESSLSGSGSSRSGSPDADATRLTRAVVDGVLGDYRIIREIGRGGMGVVYEAQQISLRRKVAVKVLPLAAILDPRQLQRFQNEAQAAACLHHPNIVPVYAVGCERGVHYYAMQYIDGQSLATVVREMSPLHPTTALPHHPTASPPRDSTPPVAVLSTERSAKGRAYFHTVAQLGIQAALALEYAHQQGIVHRDIKPANLLLDRQENLWITDFGLARCQGESELTRTGDLLGTLRYMSPEQAEGKPAVLDHRTDIYGLGATLYELLTLQPVFTAKDRFELLGQIADREPLLPRRLNRSVPAQLETIVLKTLAKDPRERYATAQELADDLRRFLDDKPIRARRPNLVERCQRWARRHKGVVAASIVVLLTLLVTLGIGSIRLARQQRLTEERRVQARQAVDEITKIAQEWFAHQPYLEESQRELLEKALEFYKEFATETGADAAARLEAARAEHRVADIQQKLGRTEEARSSYTHSILVLRELANDSAAAKDELARSLNDWGNLLQHIGELSEAERAYREALPLFARSAGDHPDLVSAWDALAGCSSNLALCLDALGRTQEAEKAGRDALTILTKLAMDDPANPAVGYDLATCQNNLAHLLRKSGRYPEAEKHARQALPAWAKLAQEYPSRSFYRYGLATGHQNLAALLASTGRGKEAEDHYRQAINLREKLAADFPRIVEYKHALAASQKALTELLQSRGFEK
jgi:serine/threonine protein kinase/tetratricopeptide (TPR) repeat protein